jgi:hypothetical protein
VAASGIESSTAKNGIATFSGLAPGAMFVAEAEVHGNVITTESFTLPAGSGARLTFTAHWPDLAQREAVFDGLSSRDMADGALVAQVRANGLLHRSAPFQMLAARGVGVRILVLPQRMLFKFHLGGIIDDRFMGFQGAISLQNWTYAPFDPGSQGLLIPLPRGFVGGAVQSEIQERVKVDATRGLLWRGVIPPGDIDFRAGFSLPIDDGTVDFDWPLPMGAFDSDLNLQNVLGMRVELPAGVHGKLARTKNGQELYKISDIGIRPNTRMVLRTTGLPQEPAWRRWVRWAVGGVVLSLVSLATVVALAQRWRGPE